MRARYGARLAYVELPPDASRPCVVPRDAEIVITRIPLDLAGAERVDLEVEIPGHGLVKVMPDVEFEPGADAIYTCCEGGLARQAVGLTVKTHFYARTAEGDRRRIASIDTVTVLGP
jgi:hypothetical protein